MSHDNNYRPPTDIEHLSRQINEILQHCNALQKREEDPKEEPKDLYEH